MKILLSFIAGLAFLALCCMSISIPGCIGLIDSTYSGGSAPPGSGNGGDCGNVNVAYPDNPFYGWPTVTNWGAITAYYCDPVYSQVHHVFHYGIDIGLGYGTAVVATANSVVTETGYHDEMGNYIQLCAGNGWCTRYMHLSGVGVVAGQSGGWGETIGWIGSTGNSTGPHLHYEIRDPNWQAVDPLPTF